MAAGDSDLQWRFYLTSTATPQTEVIEPENWATFKSTFKRDRKAHGVWYRFTAETILLGFAGPGRTILENEFQWYGLDGTVTFLAQKRKNEWSTWVTVFTGTAVMTNREYDAQYFRCDFEDSKTSSFLNKIKNRFKIKVDLDATEDLDGNAVSTSITSYTGLFNRLQLTAEWAGHRGTGGDPTLSINVDSDNETDGDTIVSRRWWPEFQAIVTAGFTTKQNANSPGTGDGWVDAIPAHTDEFFTFDAAGDIVFSVSPIHYHIQIDNACTAGASPDMKADYSWTLKHYNAAGALQATYDRTTTGLANWGVAATRLDNQDSECPTKDGSQDFSIRSVTLTPVTFTVAATDKATFYLDVNVDDVNDVGNVTADFELDFFDNSYMTLQYLQAAASVNVKHYLIYDVLDRVVKLVTGTSNGVHSNFYKLTEQGAPTDGCGALRSLTNGFNIRGQTGNAPEVSLEEVLMSLGAIDNIGWGVEDNYLDEAWTLRVEPMEYFYADSEVLDLGTIDDFQATVDDDLVFNKINIGYKQWARGDDTLTAPDNDDFLTKTEYMMPFDKVKGDKSFMSSLIASGHLISTGLEAASDPTKTWRHDESLFVVVVERSGATFIPENNENVDTFVGFSDVTNAYNVRIAPVFMLLAHALYVNSALLGENITTAKYRSQHVSLNKVFSATISSAFTCQDPEGRSRSSNGDILVQELNYGWRLFEPTIHKFQRVMTQTQVDTLISQLTGDTIGTNYGYLTYKDEEGNTETGFPLSITYGVNSIAEFECIERSDAYLEQ